MAGVGAAATLAGCGAGGGGRSTLTLSSEAFTDGMPIPIRYTCEGRNESPPLSIGGVPAEAASLVLIMDDPDAPRPEPFLHWTLWNLPPDVATLAAAQPTTGTLPNGAVQGRNGAGRLGYTGPCPPVGDGVHAYRFTLSALDTTLDLPAGSPLDDLRPAMAGHVVAQTRLIGFYEREPNV